MTRASAEGGNRRLLDQKFTGPVKGTITKGAVTPRLAVGFDVRLLKAVTESAQANNRSVAAEVRSLVRVALKATGEQP